MNELLYLCFESAQILHITTAAVRLQQNRLQQNRLISRQQFTSCSLNPTLIGRKFKALAWCVEQPLRGDARGHRTNLKSAITNNDDERETAKIKTQ